MGDRGGLWGGSFLYSVILPEQDSGDNFPWDAGFLLPSMLSVIVRLYRMDGLLPLPPSFFPPCLPCPILAVWMMHLPYKGDALKTKTTGNGSESAENG